MCLRVSALSREGPRMQLLTLASRSLRYSTRPCQHRGPGGRPPCPRRAVQRKPPSGSGRRRTGRLRRGVDTRRLLLPPTQPPSPPAPLGTDREQEQVTEGPGPGQAAEGLDSESESESESGWGGRKGDPRAAGRCRRRGGTLLLPGPRGQAVVLAESHGRGGRELGWEGQCQGHGPSVWGQSSVAQSCPTPCDPMNRSTPGLPVHHQLPQFTQTRVH